MLQLNRVTKFYGRQRGIEDVNLEVWYGEIFGYLGPNGAGKTTTIRTILDFIRPDRGRVLVFGLDSRRRGVEIRRKVGYLPGELVLHENLVTEDFLRFFFRLKGGKEWHYPMELAERLRCPLKQKIAALSLGNKRKVGLIQALMHRPQLIILDEPTSGLDPLIQHELYQILREAKGSGQTVFLSSHNLPEVERVCDRVGIIRGGRIAAIEKVADLQARSLRNVEIRFAGPWPRDLFGSLPNAHVMQLGESSVRCQIKGEIDPLLKKLAAYRIADFICQYPALDEIFLAYYGEDGRAQ